ncbi:MAG: DNA repair protein RecN [Bacteroidota bacterium]
MLSSLFIRNYAIIRELEVDFSNGLSTITGETGAGKSILLGALSLILGERADLSVLQDKDSKCIIEGTFTSPAILKALLEKNDIDYADPCILRREISPNGKSRAFINDTPVNLPLMKKIGTLLVDIHSQHENLNLSSNLYQLQVLDAFAENEDLYKKYREEFIKFRDIKKEYDELLSNKLENNKELDFLNFQFEELQKAKLAEGEMQELENELEVLQHAEDIKEALVFTAGTLSDEENGVNTKLRKIEADLSKAASFHKISEELRDRLKSCLIELKDIAAEAEYAGEKVEHDPSRQEFIEERIGLIFKLLQKHGLESEKELIDFQRQLDEKINKLNSFEYRLEELEKELIEKRAKLSAEAENLSESRSKAINPLEKKITDLLKQLGIPNAVFKIKNEVLNEPGEQGFDRISFLFTANRKSELQDISRVASGGELSRLMLSLKYIISDSLGLPTIIFDEVDTGVSGEIAHRVSLMMKEMARNRQVFAITHLPQVAARGHQHFQVYKTDQNAHTETRLRLLNSEERLTEIAKMLSGEQTTKAAMENARELLGM